MAHYDEDVMRDLYGELVNEIGDLDGDDITTMGIESPCGFWSRMTYADNGGYPPCNIRISDEDAFAARCLRDDCTPRDILERKASGEPGLSFVELECEHCLADDEYECEEPEGEPYETPTVVSDSWGPPDPADTWDRDVELLGDTGDVSLSDD